MPEVMKSHKKWRAELKKQKRKLKRQQASKAAENVKTKNPESEDNSPEDIQSINHAEAMRILAHEQWLERERVAQAKFEEKKRKIEAEKKRIQEEEEQIKREWEERQKREEEEAKKKKEIEEKRKKKQDELLKQATANENSGGDWSNPLAPKRNPGIEKKIDVCPFFAKVAACRFGDRCSRMHDIPDTSTTLVFPGMYCHYSLDQSLRGEYDVDVNLEYEDHETVEHFLEFYRDVLPEFRKAGTVIQFKVCRNFEPHLKGNVYVQFTTEEEAMKAFSMFNARWYGGKQLSGRFAIIPSWKAAICGQYHQNKCVKGRNCNFMHIFGNPRNEFRAADRDYGQDSMRSQNSVRSQRFQSARQDRFQRNGSRIRSRSRSRDRRETKSRDIRTNSRARSRSPRSHSWRADSRSGNSGSRSSHSRQRSRSRERDRRSRSRDRGSRQRSRSRDRSKKSRPRSRERSKRSRSRTREQSKRSRSRSRERSRRSRSRSRDRRKRSRSRSKTRDKSRRKSSDRDARFAAS